MKTNSSFVGANSVVVLYTVSHVRLYVTLVIYPGDTKRMNLVGNNQPFDQVRLFEFRMLVVHLFDRLNHFFNSLKIFRLIWKTSFYQTDNFFVLHKKRI
ncbi:hypothetical protein SDC9_61537 [bioreactor metagenome]|uniref:Uncharacterized protein n=1 Tax=bioreactor metagenome TaxID=1076179 RepID=A0A644XHB7_9ZZZZ